MFIRLEYTYVLYKHSTTCISLLAYTCFGRRTSWQTIPTMTSRSQTNLYVIISLCSIKDTLKTKPPIGLDWQSGRVSACRTYTYILVMISIVSSVILLIYSLLVDVGFYGWMRSERVRRQVQLPRWFWVRLQSMHARARSPQHNHSGHSLRGSASTSTSTNTR